VRLLDRFNKRTGYCRHAGGFLCGGAEQGEKKGQSNDLAKARKKEKRVRYLSRRPNTNFEEQL